MARVMKEYILDLDREEAHAIRDSLRHTCDDIASVNGVETAIETKEWRLYQRITGLLFAEEEYRNGKI